MVGFCCHRLAFDPYADLCMMAFSCSGIHSSIYVCTHLSLSLSKRSVKSGGGLGKDCPLTSKIYNLNTCTSMPKEKKSCLETVSNSPRSVKIAAFHIQLDSWRSYEHRSIYQCVYFYTITARSFSRIVVLYN